MPNNPWNIKEKEVEDWICNSTDDAFWEEFEIIDRQVRLPFGILDILAYDERVYVIEVKAQKIEEKDVGQVLRYTNDIRDALMFIGMYESPEMTIPNPDFFPRGIPVAFKSNTHQRIHGEYWSKIGFADSPDPNEPPFVQPILIGLAPDDKTSAAIECAGIECYVWSHSELDGFSLSPHSHSVPYFRADYVAEYPEWLVSIFNKAVEASTSAVMNNDQYKEFSLIGEN